MELGFSSSLLRLKSIFVLSWEEELSSWQIELLLQAGKHLRYLIVFDFFFSLNGLQSCIDYFVCNLLIFMFVLLCMQLWRINETTFNFRVFNNQFVGLNVKGNGIDLVAKSNTTGSSEIFQIVRESDDSNRVRIKAPNGFFLQVILISFFFLVFINLSSFQVFK